MLSDNLIENTNVIVLKNLISNPYKDTWSPGNSDYGFVTITYTTPVMSGRKYYQRATVKFDTANIRAVMYLQGGAQPGPEGTISTANTEMTISGIYAAKTKLTSYSTNVAYIYTIPNNTTAMKYAKDLITYDVTDLYRFLLGYGVISSESELKTWCDNNLECHLPEDPMLVSTDIDASGKMIFKTGSVMATSFVAGDSLQSLDSAISLYDKTPDNYFDNGYICGTYNNSGNGNVTITRIDGMEQGSPFYPEHKNILQITNTGPASPGLGGFYYQHQAKANGVFVEKIVAKIPVGYDIGYGCNPQGDSPSIVFIGSILGTGKWEEYTVLYKCGATGSFYDGGYIYISGNTNVTWYVAYISNVDITGLDEDLKYFTVMPNKTIFKNGKIFARNFDTQNLFPNGDLSNPNFTITVPSGWSIDTTDGAGGSNYSLVQAVNSSGDCYYGSMFKCKINSQARYKLSCWFKGNIDSGSFLSAINYYDDEGNSYWHTPFRYVSGTATVLTQELTSGDTEIKVSSNANWKAQNYSKIGVRSYSGSTWGRPCRSNYYSGNSTLAANEGIVSGISGSDTILLKEAYTGKTLPVGTVIVENYDGSTYCYPFNAYAFTGVDTWNYKEFYIGHPGQLNDGADNFDYHSGIPFPATTLCFYINIYANYSSNPIKYSDIRLEEISESPHSERRENMLQFKTYPSLNET